MGNCLKSVASQEDISDLIHEPGNQTNSSPVIPTLAPGPGPGGGSSVSNSNSSSNMGSTGSTLVSTLANQLPRLDTLPDHLRHPPPSYQETINPTGGTSGGGGQLFYPSPNVSRTAAQLTEEEQIKIAQRMGLIQHLPTGVYDGRKKNRECVICMEEFLIGDPIRFLPCMHIYHTECIDDWLMRSFTCPSCMEPVDTALLTIYLSSYQTD